ncbi:MAG: hypothetical protein DCC43_13220, partial [Candidatus Brocadia sp.]
EAKQSFTHKKRYLLKGAYEKTYKKKKFLYSNTISSLRDFFTFPKKSLTTKHEGHEEKLILIL